MGALQVVCSPFHLGTTELEYQKDSIISFQVVVTRPQENETDLSDLQIELWHNYSSPNWSASKFSSSSNDSHSGSESSREARYHLNLHVDNDQYAIVDFTIRYRLSSEDEWTWTSPAGHNGRLFISASPQQAHNVQETTMASLFPNHDTKLETESVAARDAVGTTRLLVVRGEAPVKSPEYTKLSLGHPQNLLQWMSLERLMSFWFEPNQGKEILDTPRPSYLLAYQRTDGSHVAMLPVSGLRDDLQVHLMTEGDDDKGLNMYIKNDGERVGKGQVVIAIDESLDAAVDAAFNYVRLAFQDDYVMTKEETAPVPIKPEWYSEWTDGLFYCTWNAMYTDVNEQKLFDAIAGLDEQGVRVNGVIIDDGWQDIDEQRRWKSFSPPKDRFPNGLGGFVREVKRRYPYIKHVGVWHALTGYWNGFSPDSEISAEYAVKGVSMRKITVPNGLDSIHLVEGKDIRRLYDDFYKFLAEEGISVVKCDVQALPDDISHDSPADRRIWRDYQDAFKLASSRYFDRRVIYCMSHVSNIFLYSLLQKNTYPASVRNSNDFFPDQPESHAWHIFWNANTAVYTSRLNCLPDWDMFDTTHPQAEFHAKARSLSGGPILITDKTGETDVGLVKAMTSTDIQSSATTVLRFARPGKARYPYLNFHEGRMTKVYNKTYDLLVLGVFCTVTRRTVEALVLDDFFAADVSVTKDAWVVTRFSDSKSVPASTSAKREVLFSVDLEENRCELFTASPVLRLDRGKSCSVIGLLDKFAGAVGVAWYRVHESNHPILEIQVVHLGVLGVHVDFDLNVDRLLVTMRDVVVPKQTVIAAKGLLKIDLLAAWKELKLSGYSNELNLKIYFRS